MRADRIDASQKQRILEIRQCYVEYVQNGEHHFQFNGIRHWVRIAGAEHKTTPLVIVHGGPGGTVYTFEQTIGRLLEQARTIVYYEQRGCGRSSDATDPNSYTIPWLIDDLEQLRQTLQVEQIDLLGFSFGAELILEYAAKYPQHVRRIVAQAPASIFGSRIVMVQLNGFLLVADAVSRAEFQKIIALHSDPHEALAQIWAAADEATVDRFLFQNAEFAKRNRDSWIEFGEQFKSSGAMARAFHWLPRDLYRALEVLPKVSAPALVLTGLFDRNGGVDLNRDVSELLPDSRFQVFLQSAHFPDIEETNLYDHVVTDFLDS
jgi:proline iminopeptidase